MCTKILSLDPNFSPLFLSSHPTTTTTTNYFPSSKHLSFPFPPNKFPPKISILSQNPSRHFLFQASSDGGGGIGPPPDDGGGGGDLHHHSDAKAAVSEILQEFGASERESVEIALGSPKYTEMLTGGVRELDELSLWDSWLMSSQGEIGSSVKALSFKEKVYLMAKEKRDGGIIPLLESNGLTLSNATHLSRSLSSQTLPDLIHKVKYVKEIFFSDSDDEGLIGRNASRMMMHLSIPIDEDLQQTLSFFEKIGARRGGLDSLGSKEASFRYLIESFPRLLLLPVESHMKLVDFLKNIGVPKECMRNILLLFPPIISYDVEKKIKPRLQAFEKVGAGVEDFGRILLKYPWVLSTSIQENFQEFLSLFVRENVPKANVDRAIKSWPHILGCSANKMKVMVEQFGELGVRDKKLGQVIASSPQLLLRKPQEFLEVVYFFKEVGLDEETISRIFCRCPEIFATNIEKTLKKKLDFLAGIGVSKKHHPRVIRKYPELFLCDVNRTLLPRIRYLRKSGLSKSEVGFMICRFSPLLGYSIEEVLRPKMEFLLKTMEKTVKDVVEYPRYFSYSLEKKIKPRYYVLKGKNVEEFTLKDMLGKNDEEFAAEFLGVERPY